jgi:hypothetical protein
MFSSTVRCRRPQDFHSCRGQSAPGRRLRVARRRRTTDHPRPYLRKTVRRPQGRPSRRRLVVVPSARRRETSRTTDGFGRYRGNPRPLELEDSITPPSDLGGHSLDFSLDGAEVWHGLARRVESRTRTKAKQKGKPLVLVVQETEHPNRPPEALEPNTAPRWASGPYLVRFQTRR